MNMNMNNMNNYLIEEYDKRIYKLLDDKKYPLFLREHYSESPNWYINNSTINKINTLLWMTYNKTEKEEILNKELIEYKM